MWKFEYDKVSCQIQYNFVRKKYRNITAGICLLHLAEKLYILEQI